MGMEIRREIKQMVWDRAETLNNLFNGGRITEEEALKEMGTWAKDQDLLQIWYSIDNQLSLFYEGEGGFWLIRRIRNTISDWR